MSEPQEDLDDLYENAPCGYVSLTPDGHIVKLNRTLAIWLGRAQDELIARKFIDVMGFGGRIAYETHLAPMLRLQGHVGEIAFELLDANSNKIPVIANASEKRDVNGRHLLTRITLFRALDRRLYERSLKEARDQAVSEVAAGHETAHLREQFIAVLGHDLRNPLAAIRAGTGLLEREVESERGRVVLTHIDSSLARANLLIDNILDFARGRLGEGLTLARDSEAPLTPVLEQVVDEIRRIAPDRTVVSSFDIDEPLNCDRQRIGQLASNLLSNALAHGDPTGEIGVEARSRDNVFTFSVTNRGAPIPANAREKLFQPFFRGEARQSQQGLGLGLFIVNEIAKAHGGTMDVTSNEGATTFRFSMPIEQSTSGNL